MLRAHVLLQALASSALDGAVCCIWDVFVKTAMISISQVVFTWLPTEFPILPRMGPSRSPSLAITSYSIPHILVSRDFWHYILCPSHLGITHTWRLRKR